MDGKRVTNKLEEISVSAGSALVGFAIGGSVGAAVGGALPPALQMVNSLWEDYKARQRRRLTNIVETAFANSCMTDEQIFEKLHLNPQLTDDVIRMIRQMEGTDSELDAVFSTLISSVITISVSRALRRGSTGTIPSGNTGTIPSGNTGTIPSGNFSLWWLVTD